MERKEQRWLVLLLAVAMAFNAVTLSPLVPWQEWLLWSRPTPEVRVPIRYGNYAIELPAQGIEVGVNRYVEFVATSADVTYGFGVFRPDGTLVFQMQVLPGHENRILWKFAALGTYDVRSTEYSGPRHSDMFVANAIHVVP